MLTVRVTAEVEWRRLHIHDDCWEPIVLPARRAVLRDLLKKQLWGGPNPDVNDYHAVFTNLFDESSKADAPYIQHLW